MIRLLAQTGDQFGSPLFGEPFSDRTVQVPTAVSDRIVELGAGIEALKAEHQTLAELVGRGVPTMTRLEILGGYLWVFVVAFAVTLLVTPLMRRLAIANGVIDHPTDPRKVHRVPIAYMGGVAVFLGLMAGILYSYAAVRIPGLIDWHTTQYLVLQEHPEPLRPSILLGMFIIMMVGLLDDILKISPRIKIAGQLVAAAALAIDDVGVQVAKAVMAPIGKALFNNSDLTFIFHIPDTLPVIGGTVELNLIYWTGTAIIAIFVLGACNASNLIDGLDGLLSGTTAICTMGLLMLALGLAVMDDGLRDSQRIVLCLALLGACLGFLPHNFNPATIFLGDAGSLLLGYCTIVIVLSLGDTGRTYLVFAGLICYSIPIIDTVLAIIRRKLAGKSISDADDQHLHHILKRMFGVKGAVFCLYGIGAGFAVLGVAMSFGRPRAIYALTLVFAAFIVVSAIKIARKKQLGL